MPPIEAETSGKSEKDHEQRYQIEEALRLLSNVQRMAILDADRIKKDPKIRGVLKDVHSQLGKLVGNGKMTEEDAKKEARKEARKLGFGKKKDGDDDEEESEEG